MNNKKYVAFISYSHKDKAWAEWLHRAIETYRLPKDVMREYNLTSSSVRPVFLDRHELTSGGGLNSTLQDVIRNSGALLLICSPNAAQSERVADEISYFISLGHADRIFPIIIDGHPQAELRGYDAAKECFPTQLLDIDDSMLAADVRDSKGTKSDAKLRVIASILGLGLDDLLRREQARRQKRLIIATAVSTTGLAVMTALATVTWFARIEAEQQRVRAEQTGEFLVQLFEAADPSYSQGETITARQILDQGARQLRYSNVDGEVKSDLQLLLSNIYLALGLLDRSVELADEAMVYRAEAKADDSQAYADGLEQKSILLWFSGRFDEAIESQQEVLRIRIEEGEAAPIYRSKMNLANCYLDKGKYDEARTLFEEALEGQLNVYPEGHNDTIDTYNGLATVFQELHDYDAAIEYFTEGLKVAEKVHDEINPYVASTLNNLGLALKYKGEFEEAERYYQRSMRIRQRLYGDEHPAVALAMNNIASLKRDSGDLDGALEYFEQAHVMFRVTFGDRHPRIAMVLYNMGVTLIRQKKYAQAAEVITEALDQRLEFFGEDHNQTGYAYVALGIAQSGFGNYDAAQTNIARAINIDKKIYGEGSVEAATSTSWMAGVLFSAGKLDQAVTVYEEVLRVYKDERGATYSSYIINALELAEVEIERGEFNSASSWLIKIEDNVPKESWRYALFENLHATVLAENGKVEEARQLFQSSLDTASTHNMDQQVYARMRTRAERYLQP